MQKKRIVFFLNWVQGNEVGLTGGDRIWIELARRWNKKTQVTIVGSEEAVNLAKKSNLTEIEFIRLSKRINDKHLISILNLFKNSIRRTIEGIIFLFRFKEKIKFDFVYSSSDFPADSIPAFFFKIMNPKIKWIAGFYLFAPNPFSKNYPYKGINVFRGVSYFLSQFPVYLLIKKHADYIFVTSEPDIKKFITAGRDKNKVIAVQGGVDINESENYLISKKIIPVKQRKYDACFIGRFHYQKGAVELIDIWKNVCRNKKDARLAIVGNGILEEEIRKKITSYRLNNNIDVFGFKDGGEKFDIFKNSKVILHPATYDSGGMAMAEGMAWSLPGVSFDLESLRTYYPKGIIKTPCFDYNLFANNILNLINDEKLYLKYSNESLRLIRDDWDWDKRADRILDKLLK